MRKMFVLIVPVIASVLTILLTATVAQASTRPPTTTVIWTPHPDDETLRLAGYITYAKAQGDILVLVAMSDGEASSRFDNCGFTGAEDGVPVRIQEQEDAWNILTGGTGKPIIRLGLPDGTMTATQIKNSFASVQSYAESFGRPVEHYVASSVHDDHQDHRNAANAVTNKAKEAGSASRHSRPPGSASSGTTYYPTSEAIAEEAHQAYSRFGMCSVPSLFAAAHNVKHRSRIVGPYNYLP